MFMPMFVHCEMWTCLPMFPQGFLDMLEKFASFTINLEVALFIFCMLLKARNSENRYVHSCLPSSVCCSRHTTLKTGMGRVVYLHLLYAAQGTQLWKQVRAELSTLIVCMLLKACNSENRYVQSCLPSSSVCCSRHATLKTGTFVIWASFPIFTCKLDIVGLNYTSTVILDNVWNLFRVSEWKSIIKCCSFW